MTSQNQKRHLLDLPESELVTWLAGQGERPFRAKQIRQWLFQKRIESFGEMTDVGARLRHSLEQDFFLWSARACEHQIADDGTEKLLLVLADGGRIECVLLFDDGRRTICVSSQVGCAMGCVFCASGLDGVERNLTRGEILEQMLRLQHRLPDEERLSHIVMMGMGEPLANLDRVLSALDEARNATGLGISPRRITISTVGLPPAIRRLAEHPAGFNLAISLHAPTDELRTQ
jgi:23S rRNA (adenine2503-C2)-methyltransferase